MNTNHSNLFFFLLLLCFGCVPLQQQIADGEAEETAGFVGSLLVDAKKFDELIARQVFDRATADEQLHPSNNITYEGIVGGKLVYIRNCKCLRDIKIIQGKLVATHSYGGGESNRERTHLLWNGTYYQNSKGEFIVDVGLYADGNDIRRALFVEKKVLDLEGLQVKGANFVWLNLLGYDQLIRYDY